MKKTLLLISTLVLFVVLFVNGTVLSQTLYSSYLGVEDNKSKNSRQVLFSKNIQSNKIVEFYKFDGAMVLDPKVSQDGNLIAVRNSYRKDNEAKISHKTLDIISSEAEYLYSLDELTDYLVLDFCFDPTSKFIAFVAGIENPYENADFSKIPVGFGILNISEKSIKWVTGGPEKTRNPIIQYCSWPKGGSIFVKGWTNDNNDFLRVAYGIDDITFKPNQELRHQGNSVNGLFRVDPLSLTVTRTGLNVEYPDSFSPDGKYYYSSSMFGRIFKIYDSNTGENVAGNMYEIIGDTLNNFGLSIYPKWLGNSGSVLALDLMPTKRYERGILTGPSRWIFNISTMEVIFQEHTDDYSFDVGLQWKGSGKDIIIKRNDEFKLLDPKVIEKINKAIKQE